MAQAENPRAVVGDNQAPNYAERVSEEMARSYAALSESVTKLLADARALPEKVETPEHVASYSAVVVGMRDAGTRGEAFRKAEKEPYLRGGQAVDQFFSGMKERLDKTIGILTQRVHRFNEAKLAAERAERARVQREAEEREAEARRILQVEQYAQREAEAAAARARKPENIEAHQAAATSHAITAAAAAVDARNASQAADEARIEATRKPADLVRQRTDEGHLNTMRQVPYVEILDRELLDRAKLWAFIKDEHLLMALKAWGKVTGHRVAMAGAIVEMRDDTVIR